MQPRTYPFISADGHVNESDAMWERVPEKHRDLARTRMEKHADGLVMGFHGSKVFIPKFGREMTDSEKAREFRNDPTGGADIAHRTKDQLRDGVAAEVVFPNSLLALGTNANAEFNLAVARAYNDWVHEIFSPARERYVAAALIPVDDIASAVAEAQRCLALGFRTLMAPCAYAWRPYDRPDYEPLWSVIEESGVPLNFHVFTGNVFFGTDFASVEQMTPDEFFERRTRSGELEYRVERLSTTVIGMAAGMGPIVHLTGGGVLERHPRLKFVVTEAECGWLAWTLHAMDAMQSRRRLGLQSLTLKPSEYFRRQGAVTITDDPVALRLLDFTGTDTLMWGNDYPHDEGTFPDSKPFIDQIRAATTPDVAYQILAGNAARIYGFDVNAIGASQRGQTPF
jgi:predicted TIM-barrel fold metal-dependent hydrolase